MTAEYREHLIGILMGIRDRYQAMLDACPNREWWSDRNQARLAELIRVTGRLRDLGAL